MVCMSHEGYNLNAWFLGLAYAALLFVFRIWVRFSDSGGGVRLFQG